MGKQIIEECSQIPEECSIFLGGLCILFHHFYFPINSSLDGAFLELAHYLITVP